MAPRFWVGGSGNWDDTTHWSSTSGGAGGSSAPGSSDDVTIDGHASGLNGGTITVNVNFDIRSLTTSAMNGTLDFATNNNSPTFNTFGWTNNGTGTRTINLGSGTFSFTGISTTALAWNTTTNLTLNRGTATFAFSGNTSNTRQISLGTTALSYPNITIAANTGFGNWIINAGAGGAPTIAGISVAAPNNLLWSGFNTYVLESAPVFTDTSSSNTILWSPSDSASNPVIQTSNAINASWMAVRAISFSGGGNVTFTNSFDLKRNGISGGGSLSITVPSGGGDVVPYVIG